MTRSTGRVRPPGPDNMGAGIKIALSLLAVALLAALWVLGRGSGREAERELRAPLGGHQASAGPRGWSQPVPLAPGQGAEHPLAGGEVHRYRILLAPGQFLEVLVEQRGVDAVVRLLEPGGRERLRVDSPNAHRGPEWLHFLVDAPGGYLVEVAAPVGSEAGRYALRATVREGAGDRERSLAAAAEAFYRGEEQRRRGGKARSALEAYTEALSGWRAGGNPYGEALTLHRMGQVLDGLGRVAEALAAFEESARRYRESGDSWGEGIVLNQVGRLSRASGRLEAALNAHARAHDLFEALGERRSQAVQLNNLGLAHKAAGAAYEALEAYRRALELWRGLDVPGETATTLTNLGDLYILTGQLPLAEESLAEALALRRQAGEAGAEAYTLNSLGFTHLRQGDLESARERFQEALAAGAGGEPHPSGPVALLGLAATHLEAGELQPARDLGHQALRDARKLQDRSNEATAWLYLGWVAQERGAVDAAMAAFGQALPLARELGARELEGSVLFGMAGCLRRRGVLGEALQRAGEALARVESFRQRAASRSLQDPYLAFRHNYYELYIDLLMELDAQEPGRGHGAAALEASERSRARGLIEALAGRELTLRGAVPASLRDEERRLQERLAEKELERLGLEAQGARGPRREHLDGEVRRLTAELHHLEARMRRESPSYTALTRPEPLDLAGIREQVLDSETILLEYSLGEERSFLWMVSQEAFRHHALPGRRDLERLALRAYRRLTESHLRGGRVESELAAARLAEILLKPVASEIQGRRLVVVAEGALQYVPFAALPSPASGRPLVVDHEIITLPSATVMAVLRQQLAGREPPPGTLAVLADPVFGPPAAGSSSGSQPGPSSFQGLGRLPRLPHSREEAEAILALVPEAKRRAALGPEASRDLALGGELAGYRMLHFATHGQLDTEHPELSRLIFSQVDAQGRPRDGVLWGYQVYDLDLPADLVVLSACRTALGKEVRGEGMMSLTRGFMHAGSARVVVSLWNVGDRATAVLMERFYRAMLRQGLTPAAALRQAQVSMLKEEKSAAPYHWAGFLLQGEWR